MVMPENEEIIDPIEPVDTSTAEEPEVIEEVKQEDDLPTDNPVSPSVKSVLDSISADDQPKEEPPTESEEEQKIEERPAAEEPKTPEQEEAELLDGVKSERGKERIRQVFSERKQLETDLNEFRGLITSTKMSPAEFAQTLEFGRLMNSGDEKDLRVALEMVEQQRAILAQRLGVEAPGVDLLAGHDDLKQSIENMELTKERALEIAKYRKQESEKNQRIQIEQQTQQGQEQFQRTVHSAATQMEAYLSTRANEVDHPVKLKAISDHFRNPANLQAFVSTYQPEQWTNTLKLMYDNIVVPKAPMPQQPQPIRSRPSTLGAPTTSGQTSADRIASRLESMNI